MLSHRFSGQKEVRERWSEFQRWGARRSNRTSSGVRWCLALHTERSGVLQPSHEKLNSSLQKGQVLFALEEFLATWSKQLIHITDSGVWQERTLLWWGPKLRRAIGPKQSEQVAGGGNREISVEVCCWEGIDESGLGELSMTISELVTAESVRWSLHRLLSRQEHGALQISQE